MALSANGLYRGKQVTCSLGNTAGFHLLYKLHIYWAKKGIQAFIDGMPRNHNLYHCFKGSRTPQSESSPTRSVTLQHAIHQVTQRSPKVSSSRKVMFVHKKDIVLEARVQMWLET